MITFAIAWADRKNNAIPGGLYLAAVIADAYWLSSLAGFFK